MIAACLWAAGSQAEPSLLIHPTLIIFDKDSRTNGSLNLVNRGDSRGTFEVAWVDFRMTPEGGLQKMTTQAPWSLEPLIRFSPRRVTLDPGETQVVRIALRRNLNRPEGEYFSHIRVLTLTEIPDGSDTVDPTVQSVKISARTAIAVPVIWRNSPNDQAAKINLATLDDGAQNLLVEVQRQGHLSVRGFLHLRCNDGGKSRSMMVPVPLVIYPTIDKRTVSLPLNDSKKCITSEVAYRSELEWIDQEQSLDVYQLATAN